MTIAIKQMKTVPPSGVLEIRAPQITPGDQAEVIVLLDKTESESAPHEKMMHLGDLIDSGICGMWADRTDITDSLEFAQQLRRKAERRGGAHDDPD
ncbi:MAG: hypothetical protein NTX50_28145 [Candidatus Sumerlaeota bacterium]|nr:hypothetical protein [Candidatus Sumerlaeota bacterium]